VSFALTRHLIAPNAPKVASRAVVDTIPNPNPLIRVRVQVATLDTTMAGTITELPLVDTAGATIIAATTTSPLVVPLATAQVPAVMVSFLFRHLLFFY
jgi:hypothetical protein